MTNAVIKYLTIFCAVMLCSLPAVAGSFDFHTVDVPGSTETIIVGMNNSGNLVGIYFDQNGIPHGFLDVGGTFTTIEAPDSHSLANGIDTAGNIVGTNHSHTGSQGFQYSGGNFSFFSYPGALATGAQGVNDSGAIVGYYLDNNRESHGYSKVGSNYTPIDVPNGNNTIAWKINNAGQIVGTFFDQNNVQFGYLDIGGVFSIIRGPGNASAAALGINNLGQIVGAYTDQNGNDHGLIDVGGVFTFADFPGAISTDIFTNNDLGEIAGDYTDANGNVHGFFATPLSGVPEPASLPLLGSALASIVIFVRRHGRQT